MITKDGARVEIKGPIPLFERPPANHDGALVRQH